MLLLAYILLALIAVYAIYQRARRKAAEWDRDAADLKVEQIRTSAREDRAELGRVTRERDDARRELQVLRGHQEQTARSHGDSVRCAAERERLIEGYARDILTALGRETP